MKPVMQTKFGMEGNCLQAVIASIFEVGLSDVPEFTDDNWIPELFQWLEPRGLYPIFVNFSDLNYIYYSGYYGVSGLSARNFEHITVYKDKELIHDPHPDSNGVIPTEVLLFGSIINDGQPTPAADGDGE